MEFNINKIKTKVLIKYPYFGIITNNINYFFDDIVDTACTDGENIYFNKQFMDSLTIDEQVFIMAHEICHIAFNHIERSKNKNRDIWNIATDGVINILLIKDGLKMIKGGVNLEDAINYSAEELYEKLIKNNNQHESVKNHDLWSNESLKKELRKKHDGETSEKRKNKVKKSQETISKDKEKDAFEKNKNEQKELLEKMKEEIIDDISYEKNGSNSSDLRKINDLEGRSHLIDWRYLLRENILYDLDFSYKNATIEDGILTSHLELLPKSEVEIILDTSGSVNEELLKCFLRECKNILQTSIVKVGCFDTKFYGFKIIRNFKDIDKMEYRGGGGTDFDVAVNAFSRRVANRIIFTDGFADAPKNKLSVIWVVFGNKKIDPQGSKVIYIDDENLIKKYHK